ncbi:hypothetical protein PASE110613_09275 [Paenibacillus sediminis]|uniref:Uncharacterized protein n=1 Tax=Paenibacillus sediminis TaxID=664909 RepID=A0ABS4H6L5_9BACL|nr:hypothetical protein [Paenibacillus sediminis]MBP1938162.1 hypothetical protein [Paenibacillus sediminis]
MTQFLLAHPILFSILAIYAITALFNVGVAFANAFAYRKEDEN